MGPSTFGDALHYLAQGDHVARAGWNGKGMYLVQASAGTFLKIDGTPGDLLPFIVMKTADDKFVPWLASQTDMLATDWRLV